MRRSLTLDASVFVSACNRSEPAFESCRALLDAIRQGEVPLMEPSLMPVEVAGAIRRVHGNASIAKEFVEAILQLPHFTLVVCDEGLMNRAIVMAIEHGLRGADAVYVATAFRYGAMLVTLDNEQRRRAPRVVQACSPAEALKHVCA